MAELDEKYVAKCIDVAIDKINDSIFGRRLLQQYPAIKVSPTYYADEYCVLKKYGSPACTDGKKVYISAETMRDILSMEYKEWDYASVHCAKTYEEYWGKLAMTDRTLKLTPANGSTVVQEVRDIILHELTHAMNEHTKLQRRAARYSDEYQQKLAIAAELQANDGIIGANYADNFTQQHPGVTNKRKHRECIGYHTLREFMEHIEFTPQEQMEIAMKKILKSARASQEMAETSGAMQQIEQEIAQEDAKEKEKAEGAMRGTGEGDAGEGAAGTIGKGGNSDAMTSDDKLTAEMKIEGLRNIKRLILATISDELKYDAATDSVIYNKVRKRVAHKSYARPSKRGELELCRGVKVVRKGVKVKREVEYNKTRDLTVLAVDASGSMTDQAKYVSAILDKLLKQVEEVANEEGIKINYDNMRGMLHTDVASDLMVVTSDKWRDTMRRYRACGGNDFDCVLRAVEKEVSASAKPYETINIITLSDALGYLDADFSGTALGTYIARRRLNWIDAIIMDKRWMRELDECLQHDYHKIRKQEIIAISGEDF